MRQSDDGAPFPLALVNRQVRLAVTPPDFDKRVNVCRPDLADIALADRVSAAHYAAPVRLTCRADRTAMKSRPSRSATNVSELLFGEDFAAFEIGGGWAWGQSLHDGYVGYVAETALAPTGQTATHWVKAPEAWLFSDADIKSSPVSALPMNAQLPVTGRVGAFHAVGKLGFVHDRHVADLADRPKHPLDIAKSFLGTPYLWGGRTRQGIDCSGLIQSALMACDLPCPRDTDQQRKVLGSAVDSTVIQQGDIVFFPGHVGIMASDSDLLHANANWMTTVIEPLADVTGRLRANHAEPITAVRRLTSV